MRARRSGFSESSNGLPESRQTKKGDVMFKSVKGNLPENSLFNINSVMFNLANNKEEIKNKFSCFYNPSLEALCVLIEEKFKYADLSKEIVMNLTDFAQKIGIKAIILCLDRKNKEFVKIMQGMMTVGFTTEKTTKTAKIGDKTYKILIMNVKSHPEEIEEIAF